MGEEVGFGEVDGLLALVRDGDAGHDDVAVTVVERREDGRPSGIDELDVKALSLGDGFHQIDVKADDFFVRRFVFKGTIGRACADRIGHSLNGGGGEQSSKCGGSENFGLKRHEQTPSIGAVCRRFCGRIFEFSKTNFADHDSRCKGFF